MSYMTATSVLRVVMFIAHRERSLLPTNNGFTSPKLKSVSDISER